MTFNGYNFEPVPKTTINTEHKYTDAGGYLYTEDTITLEGYISGCGDILASGSGILSKFNYSDSDRTKQFSFKANDSTIYPDQTKASVKSFDIVAPDINRKSNTYDYTIVLSVINYATGLRTLTKEEDQINEAPIVSSVTDNYSLEISDQIHVDMQGEIVPFMTLTRNIGAVGIDDGGDKSAMWRALKWIKDRQEFSSISGMPNINELAFYNHQRQVDYNTSEGSCNISDTFLLSPTGVGAIHSYTIEMSPNTELDLQTIKIKGNIQGLEPVNIEDKFYYEDFIDLGENYVESKDIIKPTTSGSQEDNRSKTLAYDNAYSFYTGLAFSGLFWLVDQQKEKLDEYIDMVSDDPIQYMPVSINEGFNIDTASISYEYTYNNRTETLIKGALVENFSIENSSGVLNKKHKHNIIGRLTGPLLICPGTSSGVSSKTLSYEAFFPAYTGLKKYSYSQQIKGEVYGVLTSPIIQLIDNKKGYIESYNVNHNLGENRINATLKFIYNANCN